MKHIELPQCNFTIAEDQDEYQTLKVIRFPGREGHIVFGYELSAEELAEVNRTGKIYVNLMTFHRAMNPILLSTTLQGAYPPTCLLPENFEMGDVALAGNKSRIKYMVVADVGKDYVLLGDPDSGAIYTYDLETLTSEDTDFKVFAKYYQKIDDATN